MFGYNPFLWKGYYMDTETGYYYVSGRYYDSITGTFIDADDAENIAGGSLDRNAITTGNYLVITPYAFDVFTVDELMPDITYNPNLSFWEKYKTQIVACIMFIVGAVLCCFGVLSLGIPLMFGGASMALQYTLLKRFPEYDREINGAFKIINGVFTIVSGASAIATGIELFCCRKIGQAVVGALCVATGLLSVGFGMNEAMSGATGKNVIQEWMGGNETLYYGAYLFVNIATVTATAAGRAVMACFIAGTQVVTKDGNKNIEDIQVGDEVLAYDEATGKQEYKKVVRLFRNTTDAWWHIHVNGEEIVCTGGHPFYVPDFGKFIPAKELHAGTKLLLSSGECVTIEKIEVEQLETPETTYNFEVEDFHTYYVTDSEVLVHNKCPEDDDAIIAEIKRIASKYDNLKCVECANEIETYLKSKGLHGARVEVLSKSGYIVSDFYGGNKAISLNGYHVGIKYGGLVYDNIHKTGIEYVLWKSDFFSPKGVYFPKPKKF